MHMLSLKMMKKGLSSDKRKMAKKMNKSVSNDHKQHDDVFRTPLFVLTTYQLTEQQTRLG